MGRPVVHFDIGCKDKQSMQSFYSDIFDWGLEPYGPFSTKFDTQSDKGITGHLTALGHEPHNYVMFYIEVDDIPRHLREIEARGGSVMIPETQIPDGGHFAWFKDPEGNMLGLFKPK